jgi:hypothetical protein
MEKNLTDTSFNALVTALQNGTPVTITRPYPFVRATYDETGEGKHLVPTWNPGVHRREWVDANGSSSEERIADGVGEIRLTLVSVHRPGGFPTRVFYQRQWTSPNGKLFGRNRLYVTTLAQFKQIARGYRYDYQLSGPSVEDVADRIRKAMKRAA